MIISTTNRAPRRFVRAISIRGMKTRTAKEYVAAKNNATISNNWKTYTKSVERCAMNDTNGYE